ncbi:MAG TPA: hypothetical protein VFU02_16075 [Polyangiaceae bacterium]|nr:hypothetical protein [Polyangiaceae bacterium]
MLLRTEQLLGRFRLVVGAGLALGVLHCGDGERTATEDLVVGGTSDAGDTSSTDRGLTGNWGMFLFEDPVAIRLAQEGDVLTGVGCCIPDLVADQYCCGPITGSLEGDRLSFSFPLGELGDRYHAEAVVSEDGKRLGGSFFREDARDTPRVAMKTAWLRYESDQGTWLTTYPDLENELRDVSGSVLRLSDASEAGHGYQHGADYQLLAAFGSVGGDLGPFWGSEIRVRESDGAIVAGPVPVTDPNLPQSMLLHRDGTTLLDAEVTMASGAIYRFDVVSQGRP